MAERMLHRAGSFAVYRGDVYRVFGDAVSPRLSLVREEEGDPIPEGLTPKPQEPTRVFYASPDQLDDWYRTRWTFRWHDQPFDAVGSSQGKITGWYTGRQPWLIEEQLQRTEANAWLGTVPLAEVTDLTEHREDLMADWKAEHPS